MQQHDSLNLASLPEQSEAGAASETHAEHATEAPENALPTRGIPFAI